MAGSGPVGDIETRGHISVRKAIWMRLKKTILIWSLLTTGVVTDHPDGSWERVVRPGSM